MSARLLQITISAPPAPVNLQQNPSGLQQSTVVLLQITGPPPLVDVPGALPEAAEPPRTIDMQQNFVCELQRKVDLQQNNGGGLPARVDLQQIEADLQHPILCGASVTARGRLGTLDLQHNNLDLQQNKVDLQPIQR